MAGRTSSVAGTFNSRSDAVEYLKQHHRKRYDKNLFSITCGNQAPVSWTLILYPQPGKLFY